jgi:hypothetical protein
MKLVRAAAILLALAAPALACPNCKNGLLDNELTAWFIAIVGMLAAPFVIGGAAFGYIALWGRKGRPGP